MFNYLVNYFKVLVPQKSKKGQALVEYALIIALIAVALITGLGLLKTDIAGVFTSITAAI
ncbi:MAG: Flp family type IVb pilin [Clostridiaceae bacterium]